MQRYIFASLVVSALLGTALASCTTSSVPFAGTVGSAGVERVSQNASYAKPARVRPAFGWPQGVFITDRSNSDVMGIKHCGGPNSQLCTPPPPVVFNNGIGHPLGVWSSKHELFVANETANTVTSYAQNSPVPDYTYSNGISTPQDVTTGDQLPHYVYVANYGVANTGYVSQYSRHHNTVVHQCVLNAYVGPFGVAVLHKSSVFVSWDGYTGGQITEYAGGLQGCNATVLPLSFNYVQGITFDAAGNLLVCDAGANTIYKVPPPYTSPSVFVSGFSARYVHVNEANTQVVATDFANHVYLFSYPGGTPLQTLGSGYGLSQAAAAVDWKNSVP
jgi:hypothetical protein